MGLKLVRKHKAGKLKIYDRKPSLDKDKKPIKDKYDEVIHMLPPEAYDKTVKFNDEEYVLKRHGAILKKV